MSNNNTKNYKVLQHNKIKYVIRYPEEFSENETYPLLIFIHGAGGRGMNIDTIYNHSFFGQTDKYKLNMVSVAPQCYENSWFSIFEQLQEFVKDVIMQEFIDKSRVYLMGASMGAYATWQLAMSRPELFAAIVPICGGGMYWNAERLKEIPVWAFHGSDDNVVFCRESENMVQAINKCGGNAKLTVFEGVEHNSWSTVFNYSKLFDWLIEQQKHIER